MHWLPTFLNTIITLCYKSTGYLQDYLLQGEINLDNSINARHPTWSAVGFFLILLLFYGFLLLLLYHCDHMELEYGMVAA